MCFEWLKKCKDKCFVRLNIKIVIAIGIIVYYVLVICIFTLIGKLEPGVLFTILNILPFAFVAIFQEEIKRRWFTPELVIEFELNEPFCSKTPFYIEWTDNKRRDRRVSTEAYYFRIGVKNIGNTQARSCEVFLADQKEYIDGKWKRNKYFQQVRLRWDRGNPQEDVITYTNINPSPIRYLSDIGHIFKMQEEGLQEDEIPKFKEDCGKFHLEFLYGIGGYQPRQLEPNKKYKIKIIVVSENAKNAAQDFELLWNGEWRDDSKEMFKQISIKKV